MALATGFDADFPVSYYFDIAQMVDPLGGNSTIPDASKTVRFYAENWAPNNLSYFSMKLYAGADLLWTNAYMGYKACNQWNGSLCGRNSNGMDPSTWRIVYDLDAFKATLKSGLTDTWQTSSPIFPWYMGFFCPFSLPGWWYANNPQGQFGSFSRAFAVLNPAASEQSLSRTLEGGRDPTIGSHNTDGFPTNSIFYVESGVLKWDEGQSNLDNGFSLITWMKQDTGLNNLGMSQLAVRNVNRADSEVLSLGQFQQVNLSPRAWQPAFPVGNSEASPWVDRANLAGINSYNVGAGLGTYAPITARSAQKFPNNATNDFVDMSFLLNESLWDGYFLSSVPQTGTLALNNSTPLPNGRYRFRLDANFTGTDVRNFDNAAGFLDNFGAFNVNSTSVDAWKALFTAFRGLKITGAADGKSNPSGTVPVSRTLIPGTGPIGFTSSNVTAADIGAMADTGPSKAPRDYSKLFTGFRYLTDDMINTLAKRIVDEVRLRGPFLSLSDFVNRRLVAPQGAGMPSSAWQNARTTIPPGGRIDAGYDPVVGLQGINGALQRALNVSGINGSPNYPFAAANNDRVFYTTANSTQINALQPMEQMADSAWYLDTEHLTGMPAGEIGHLMDHIPGFVTQADLLAMIGPELTARGDTFLVRSYGDAVNPANQKVQTRAWLEAVVQRVQEPVTPLGADKWKPDAQGRRFRIISLRWLAPEEV